VREITKQGQLLWFEYFVVERNIQIKVKRRAEEA
jgi:hypothetical protein